MMDFTTPEHLCSSGEWGNYKLIIALASMLRLHIHIMSVSNAFCYADIAGDVYVGTTDDEKVESGWCYKLQKLLFTLRLSPLT